MWQKVWIVAGSATLQQKAAGEVFPHPLPPGFEIREDDWSGWVSECSLRVMCEADYLAQQKRSEATGQSLKPDDPFYAEAIEIFREVILPEITDEVNTSAEFAPLRQAYFGVALPSGTVRTWPNAPFTLD
jgi:hypothetical protein